MKSTTSDFNWNQLMEGEKKKKKKKKKTIFFNFVCWNLNRKQN